jgi:hypothetical protein
MDPGFCAGLKQHLHKLPGTVRLVEAPATLVLGAVGKQEVAPVVPFA